MSAAFRTGSAAGLRSSSAHWLRACCHSPTSMPSASGTCHWRSSFRCSCGVWCIARLQRDLPAFYPELFPDADPGHRHGHCTEVPERPSPALLPAGAVRDRGGTSVTQHSADHRLDHFRGDRRRRDRSLERSVKPIEVHLNDLGEAEAIPVDKDLYDQMRAQTSVTARSLARASA